MNRPTVPPVVRRGDDPILDALVDGRGDQWLLARMERGLRRVPFLPKAAPWTPEMPWLKRYARLALVVSFAVLAPGLVALSLLTVSWAAERLRDPAEVSAVAAESSAPAAPSAAEAAGPMPAVGARAPEEAPVASSSAVSVTPPRGVTSATSAPSPRGAVLAPAVPSGSAAPTPSVAVPNDPTFTPEQTY